MRPVFVDTSFYVAIFNEDDDLHGPAVRLAEELTREPGTEFVSSEAILVEFLTFVRRGGARVRIAAVDYVEAHRRQSGVTIVPHTKRLFDASLALYRSRPDKRYSMTDCISMVICRERAISEVLTHDRDFAQEGFTILL
ncbi:MAG TPA: PIN domain-containing protein [Dehalococcoidia bacterium]|nr:PIN domain-containing protein [Dehalococcoidia bacterium]